MFDIINQISKNLNTKNMNELTNERMEMREWGDLLKVIR